MLLKQVWPHDGSAAKLVVVGVWVANAVEQYALPYAIMVLATELLQAPLAQSRSP